jgi:hypothetical protein
MGVLKVTKKEKNREEKFSKIFDDISSDTRAEFSEVTICFPPELFVMRRLVVMRP